jgi:hypothetical protein
MAKIDNLLAHVSDTNVREQLQIAVQEIGQSKQFWLVFEQHIPETVLLSGLRPKKHSLVVDRTGSLEGEWIVEECV